MFLSHLAQYGIHPIPGFSFVGAGKYGVYLFFTLSAFLLATPFFGHGRTPGPGFLLQYALRRVLRIYPLYTVVLISYWLISRAGNQTLVIPIKTEEILTHLILQQGKDLLWAIPVEFTFYIVLPFMVLAVMAADQLKKGAGFLLIAGIFLMVPVWWPAGDFPPNAISLWRYLQLFIMGIMLAQLLASDRITVFAKSYSTILGLLGWLAFIVMMCTLPHVWGLITSEAVGTGHFHQDYWLYAVIWGLVLIANHADGLGMKHLLSWQPLILIGKGSFSIYLLHIAIVRTTLNFFPEVNSWIHFVIILFATSVLALISYRAIEKPMYQLAHSRINFPGSKVRSSDIT